MAASQKDVILSHLMANRTITSQEAFTKYGVTRLSAIIFNLRREGYQIATKKKHGINRYGNTVNYGEYMLKG